MTNTKPFGNIQTAKILIIGHDPRLQKSDAEAAYAFFFDYLVTHESPPTYTPEKRKYGLAKAVREYVNDLAGREIPLESLYITNLCNEFIVHEHGSGTVLIPDDVAERGVEAIRDLIAMSNFEMILPMSVQVLFHLCRLRFLDEDNQLTRNFVLSSRPAAEIAKQKLYKSASNAPFLAVCGKRFHHHGIPVLPILHVKQWPLSTRLVKYKEPMENARREISAVIIGMN